jgi:hypothetical protein
VFAEIFWIQFICLASEMNQNLSDESIVKLPVKELKKVLQAANVSYADCFEKSDLIARVKEARNAG